jgi:hypothetical protein
MRLARRASDENGADPIRSEEGGLHGHDFRRQRAIIMEWRMRGDNEFV